MANLFTCGLHQWAGFQPCPSCDRSQSAPPAAPDVDGLVAALGYQRQIDDDGTECGVSRQAVDEVRTLIVEQRDTITRLASALAEAERERDGLRACVEAAESWIAAAPHGDNCFVCAHYDGDPGDQCNCGKDSILSHIESARAALAQKEQRNG